MSWLEVSVQVSKEKAPLVEHNIQANVPAANITALFDANQPREPLSRLLSLVPGIDRPQQVSFRKVEDQQWERAWLDRFKPMQFGRDLWIVRVCTGS